MSRGALVHALLLPVFFVDPLDFLGEMAEAIMELAEQSPRFSYRYHDFSHDLWDLAGPAVLHVVA